MDILRGVSAVFNKEEWKRIFEDAVRKGEEITSNDVAYYKMCCPNNVTIKTIQNDGYERIDIVKININGDIYVYRDHIIFKHPTRDSGHVRPLEWVLKR